MLKCLTPWPIGVAALCFSFAFTSAPAIAGVVQLPTGEDAAEASAANAPIVGAQQPDRFIPLAGGLVLASPARGEDQQPLLPLLRRANISSRYGIRSDPFSGQRSIHAGIDLPLAYGAQVDAARGGRVVAAGWHGGYGIMVTIDHGNGIETRYAHLSRALVTIGQHVGDGQVIGLVGSTGRSTGSHLHYEVRVNGMPVDPLGIHIPDAMHYRSLLTPWLSDGLIQMSARQSWAIEPEHELLPHSRIE